MEPAAQHPSRSLRTPMVVWAVLAVTVAAAVAALVLRVPIEKALSFGLLGVMLVVHVFMHAGGHGGHSHVAADTLGDRPDETPAGADPCQGCH